MSAWDLSQCLKGGVLSLPGKIKPHRHPMCTKPQERRGDETFMIDSSFKDPFQPIGVPESCSSAYCSSVKVLFFLNWKLILSTGTIYRTSWKLIFSTGKDHGRFLAPFLRHFGSNLEPFWTAFSKNILQSATKEIMNKTITETHVTLLQQRVKMIPNLMYRCIKIYTRTGNAKYKEPHENSFFLKGSNLDFECRTP